MMSNDKCKCPHHMFAKLLVLLAWIAAVLFFWGSIAGRTFMGMDASYWAWSVVILVLLTKSMRGTCGCCCGDKHCNTCAVDSGK